MLHVINVAKDYQDRCVEVRSAAVVMASKILGGARLDNPDAVVRTIRAALEMP
jgi:hypothetical protein